MANTGSGSLATILFLFMLQAALHKGKTFSLQCRMGKHFLLSMHADEGVFISSAGQIVTVRGRALCIYDVVQQENPQQLSAKLKHSLQGDLRLFNVYKQALQKRYRGIHHFGQLTIVNRFAATQLPTLKCGKFCCNKSRYRGL